MVGRAHGSAMLALVGALLLAGCRGKSELPYAQIWTPAEAYVPAAGSGNAFDAYVRAGLDAERILSSDPSAIRGNYLGRVAYTPGQRERMLELLRSPMALVREAAAKPCTYEFRAVPPFDPAPYQKGWSVLARTFVWNIEAAIAREDYDLALRDAVVLSRLGFDLTGGNSIDASLGLTMVDQARQTIAPSLDRMSAEQLDRLANGLTAALNRRRPLARTFENDRQSFLAAVQHVQEAYQKNRMEELQERLGREVRDSVDYLREVKKEDGERRLRYFEGFRLEAEQEVLRLQALTELPSAKRDEELAKPPPEGQYRPWRRFARHFFRGPRPLFRMTDRTLARTRMLILEARIYRQIKATGRAPKNLNAFDRRLTLDPFTEQPFLYRAQSAQFRLYSAGTNRIDDGGEWDDSFTEPDLRLERQPN